MVSYPADVWRPSTSCNSSVPLKQKASRTINDPPPLCLVEKFNLNRFVMPVVLKPSRAIEDTSSPETSRQGQAEVCQRPLNKPAAFWNLDLWSDETKIELFGGTAQTMFGGNKTKSIKLRFLIGETMNDRKYREILEKQLLPSAHLLKSKRGWKFQQDNDPKHTANETKEWLRMKKINILERPSQFSDTNPIENLWRELKLNIQKRGPNNITELKEICIEEWNNIAPETFKRMVVNSYKRLEAIINNKGYATKY
ncbi:hypothetical protein FHG87_014475 [Trinorchestia longiramus]|nr:hypothetical protein FHG87_014475 [Trinorchestia longiramus]